MWPFVRDVIRSRFSEERKPDDQMILRSISTVLANSGDDEGGVARRKIITAVRRAAGEQEMKRLAALDNEDELAPVNLFMIFIDITVLVSPRYRSPSRALTNTVDNGKPALACHYIPIYLPVFW
ncbi:hypothetical protein OUZ56_033666 [Daphnia magna]|uniref:Uncharacterized protein n=1 Tax=Daphnia magna TaxID=35525 RepID=A0ABR0BAZ2_9CRUS|nr:hypothetical protein OUZ56_033425 [Daphnia magna]KAK4045755.1 hypothetical protein OUZ56_033666 [Daphnia magna]